MASLGSTERWPGVDSGIRERCTYSERSLVAESGAPGPRGGTSARVSAAAGAVTATPAAPVRTLRREGRPRFSARPLSINPAFMVLVPGFGGDGPACAAQFDCA